MAEKRDESLGGEIDRIMGSFNKHTEDAQSALIESQNYFSVEGLLTYDRITYTEGNRTYLLSPFYVCKNGGLYCQLTDTTRLINGEFITTQILLFGSLIVLGENDSVRDNIEGSELLERVIRDLYTDDECEEKVVDPETSNTPTGFVVSKYISWGRYLVYQVIQDNSVIDNPLIQGEILVGISRISSLTIEASDGTFTLGANDNNE